MFVRLCVRFFLVFLGVVIGLFVVVCVVCVCFVRFFLCRGAVSCVLLFLMSLLVSVLVSYFSMILLSFLLFYVVLFCIYYDSVFTAHTYTHMHAHTSTLTRTQTQTHTHTGTHTYTHTPHFTSLLFTPLFFCMLTIRVLGWPSLSSDSIRHLSELKVRLASCVCRYHGDMRTNSDCMSWSCNGSLEMLSGSAKIARFAMQAARRCRLVWDGTNRYGEEEFPSRLPLPRCQGKELPRRPRQR